jgi:hypothetical protein
VNRANAEGYWAGNESQVSRQTPTQIEDPARGIGNRFQVALAREPAGGRQGQRGAAESVGRCAVVPLRECLESKGAAP